MWVENRVTVHSSSHSGKTRTNTMVRGDHLRVLLGLIACVCAACGLPQINKLVYNNNGLGAYSFEYKTPDGTYRREDGGLVAHPGGESMVVRGEYGYIDPLGRLHSMRYIADENGFQPQTDNLDTRYNDRKII